MQKRAPIQISKADIARRLRRIYAIALAHAERIEREEQAQRKAA